MRALCYACLCDNAATDVLKGAGITVGKKLTEQAIGQLPFEVILKINQKVGFRLITKFGQTGAINLGKAVPLVGGVIGGTFDGTTTYTIGRVARHVFVTDDEPASAEQPGEAEVIEGFSETLFGKDGEQDAGLYWETPREREGRPSFWDWDG